MQTTAAELRARILEADAGLNRVGKAYLDHLTDWQEHSTITTSLKHSLQVSLQKLCTAGYILERNLWQAQLSSNELSCGSRQSVRPALLLVGTGTSTVDATSPSKQSPEQLACTARSLVSAMRHFCAEETYLGRRLARPQHK